MPKYEFEIRIVDYEMVEADSLDEARKKIETKFKNQLAMILFLHEIKPLSIEEVDNFTRLHERIKKNWSNSDGHI